MWILHLSQCDANRSHFSYPGSQTYWVLSFSFNEICAQFSPHGISKLKPDAVYSNERFNFGKVLMKQKFRQNKKRKNNMCSGTAIKFLSWPDFPQSVRRGQTEPFFLFWPYVIYFTKLHVYVYFQISTHNCAQ